MSSIEFNKILSFNPISFESPISDVEIEFNMIDALDSVRKRRYYTTKDLALYVEEEKMYLVIYLPEAVIDDVYYAYDQISEDVRLISDSLNFPLVKTEVHVGVLI